VLAWVQKADGMIHQEVVIAYANAGNGAAKGEKLADSHEMMLSKKYEVFYNEVLMLFERGSSWPRTHDRMRNMSIMTRSIEFLREQSLEKLYFRFPEKDMMSQIHRDRVLAELDYSTPQNKARAFISQFDKITGTLAFQKKLKGLWWARFVADSTTMRWQVAVLILTYILNVLMVVSLSADYPGRPDDPSLGDNGTALHLAKDLRDPTDFGQLPEWFEMSLLIFGSLHVAVSLGVTVQYFVNVSSGENFIQLLTSGGTSLYYVMFFAASIAGLFYNGYFYAFHLLYIVQNNKDLKSAVSAITYNGKGLLWVSFLTVTIVFLFSVIMFLFYREDFDAESGLFCNSLIDCFATILGTAMEEGGIRIVLGAGQQEPGAFTFNSSQKGRVAFDLLFWVVLTVIMMNLVLGIIVDTFSQLRLELATRAEEMATKCFICSLPSYKFEKHGGYTKHLREDHNMWMYLYYTLYLRRITVAQRTHHQAFLYEEWVENRSPAPFPIMRSQALEIEGGDADDVLEKLVKQIAQMERTSIENQAQLADMRLDFRDNSKKLEAMSKKGSMKRGQGRRKVSAPVDESPARGAARTGPVF
jgi:hypothetical protein